MAELVAAGAPELPDGWFYRVAYDRVGLKVKIRERRTFGSRSHAYAWVYEEDHDDALSAIVDACRRVHARMTDELERREKAQAAGQFIGDHDPRRSRVQQTRT
ncbi:hypothetical protein [Streptomyces chryseus]|uniref:hypothetical protein n=1 Tax=Streptomyces chryseus TaxID=68186 RepID=UPI00110FC346|nr:hypothetical protein [Streptomyces chryseus]GGX26790.1 hypothetical protein GCM10010353_47400 [Streptomyces chryseus]